MIRPATDRGKVDGGPLSGLRIHFAGACGIGMSAMAHLTAARGAAVTGCDSSLNGQAAPMRARGIRLFEGHSPDHVRGCDVVVYTPAMPTDHLELEEARRLGVPVLHRMAMLARMLADYRSVCVSGAHGKTTTTWMLARLLMEGRLDPSALIGGVVSELRGNYRIGGSDWMACEVDESDGRMVEVRPNVSVITNLDHEHLDNYGTFEHLLDEFRKYIGNTHPAGRLIVGGDDPHLTRLAREAGREAVTYGMSDGCDVRAENVRLFPLDAAFDAVTPWGRLDGLTLPMPGRHNVCNALAAVVVARELGIAEGDLREALASCPRVGRRLQIRGRAFGATVVEDYGHHPTEICETLKAARGFCRRRLVVVFQPHRYTRTQQLLGDFARAFDAADHVIVLPIYAASEPPIAGVCSEGLAEAISRRGGPPVEFAPEPHATCARLSAIAADGDIILIQGAGDVYKVADELVG